MSRNINEEESEQNKVNVELSEIRTEMLTSLELFFSHVKYTINLQFTLIGGSFLIASFGIKDAPSGQNYLILLGCFLLMLTWPLSVISKKLVRRYFKLYAAYYVYAARLDKVSRIQHPWLEDITNYVNDLDSETAVDEFVDNKNNQEGHSWIYYKRMMSMIGWLFFLFGLIGMFFIIKLNFPFLKLCV